MDLSEALYPIVKEHIIDKVDSYDDFQQLCKENDVTFNKTQREFIDQCFEKSYRIE